MNQVEQSVTEYVDEVWEDVVADIEQLVNYPSVAVAADAEPGAPFGRPVRDALDCALGIAQKLGYQTVSYTHLDVYKIQSPSERSGVAERPYTYLAGADLRTSSSCGAAAWWHSSQMMRL